jgi:hypothetical protein
LPTEVAEPHAGPKVTFESGEVTGPLLVLVKSTGNPMPFQLRIRGTVRMDVIRVIATFLLSTPGAVQGAEPVTGIYALIKGNTPVRSENLDPPHISGIVSRSNWKTLEPSSDEFEWSYFDDAVRAAGSMGKKVMMGVFPGIMTPEWVYQKGAGRFTFVNPNPRAGGREDSIPLPWDETFLSEWSNFIRGMGKKFNRHPEVVLITMAGGAANSIEMHLPKGPEMRRQLEQAGYSRKALVDSWKRLIDVYDEAFPDKALALPVAVPLKRDGALEDIVSYAVEKLGGRLYLATGSLSDTTRLDSYLLKLIQSYGDRARIGFQLLSPVTYAKNRANAEDKFLKKPRNDPERPGRRPAAHEPVKDLRRAFEIGLEAGASYIQVYEIDVANAELSDDLEYLSRRLDPSGAVNRP